ncbi:hypothetical protein JXJ21_23835 [candidate division KSB1 bacterium]|nr:hypothetical protein [candidate division KSB1 bacterium]
MARPKNWLTNLAQTFYILSILNACSGYAAEFAIRQIILTTGYTVGFREYALRPTNLFKMNSAMNIYIEPANCTLYRTGATYSAKLQACASIESLTKPGIAQNIALGELKFVVQENDTLLYADLTLSGIGDLPIDLYKITITLTDLKSQSQTSISRKFRVGHSFIKAEITSQNQALGTNGKDSIVLLDRATPVVYCNYSVRRILANSTLKAVLIEEAPAGPNQDRIIDSFTTNLSNQRQGSIEFHPEGSEWHPGIYRLELYLGGMYEHTLQFRVE